MAAFRDEFHVLLVEQVGDEGEGSGRSVDPDVRVADEVERLLPAGQVALQVFDYLDVFGTFLFHVAA